MEADQEEEEEAMMQPGMAAEDDDELPQDSSVDNPAVLNSSSEIKEVKVPEAESSPSPPSPRKMKVNDSSQVEETIESAVTETVALDQNQSPMKRQRRARAPRKIEHEAVAEVKKTASSEQKKEEKKGKIGNSPTSATSKSVTGNSTVTKRNTGKSTSRASKSPSPAQVAGKRKRKATEVTIVAASPKFAAEVKAAEQAAKDRSPLEFASRDWSIAAKTVELRRLLRTEQILRNAQFVTHARANNIKIKGKLAKEVDEAGNRGDLMKAVEVLILESKQDYRIGIN